MYYSVDFFFKPKKHNKILPIIPSLRKCPTNVLHVCEGNRVAYSQLQVWFSCLVQQLCHTLELEPTTSRPFDHSANLTQWHVPLRLDQKLLQDGVLGVSDKLVFCATTLQCSSLKPCPVLFILSSSSWSEDGVTFWIPHRVRIHRVQLHSLVHTLTNTSFLLLYNFILYTQCDHRPGEYFDLDLDPDPTG